MKIIFICGCLEPGKDGVGDYTRRLAGELIRQGIPAGILSYNDPFVSNEALEHQVSENTSVLCLRLPSSWGGLKRSNHAKKWIQQNNPEWLSLQFVPYAFNSKGLPFGLGQQLKHMGGSAKWHIMFHELWIGMEIESSRKDILIGFIQKQVIKKIGKKLKPQAVHTQTQLYQEQLKRVNIKSERLPLFSNIPLTNLDKFERVSLVKDPIVKIELILFGAIHPEAPIEEFAEEISNYYKENNNYVKKYLTLVGRSGVEKEKWKSIFKHKNFIINDLGEQSEASISTALQLADIGVTTTPIYLVDKSGTVISMKEHKLPIISVSKRWRPKNKINVDFPEGIMEYSKGNFNKILELRASKSNQHNLKEVVKVFVNSLFLGID